MMKLFRRKPDISTAARQMAREGVNRRRAKVRATADAMRAQMGLPAVVWPECK